MTRVSKMVDYLKRRGPCTSARLAEIAELPNSGRVYALLKARIQSGQIERVGSCWMINPDYSDEKASELRDARIILERAGYSVIPPGARTSA
jgi:hypothetical protein